MNEKKRPSVSVIIPTYNRAELIHESLDSVFFQTFRDYEVIVVDDGSTDNTAEVLRPLAEQGKLRYIRQSNQGASAARNRGIAEARGNFIAFLDSDDLFDPAKLELQVKYYQAHPEMGLVHSGFTKFDNNGNDLGYRDTSWFSGDIYPRILLYWTTLMTMDTVVVAKNVFDSVGLFDSNLVYGEDLDMWRRIARKYPFGFINRSLARIRVHEGNISGNKTNAADDLAKYLEKAFEDDPSLSSHFRQRVFSKMYSTMAYNLLGEDNKQSMRAARLNAIRAIKCDLLNLHGYIAFISTVPGFGFRKILVNRWRSLRAWMMSRKRST
jgi:glycosyltransferase involved in cell wall biosynthesis